MEERHNIVDYVLTLLSASKLNSDDRLSDINLSLKQTAKEIREFLDEIPGGFLIYHADGNEDIIYVNSALLRIFGCENYAEFQTLTGGTFRGLVHPDDLAAVENSIAQQISGSRFDLDYVEYRIKRKDGSVRWVEDYGHFIHNESLGDVYYVFVTDATEKKERELSEKASLVSKTVEKERVIKSLIETHGRELDEIQREQLRRQDVIEALSINYESILYIDLDADTILPYRLSDRLKPKFDADMHALGFTSYVNDYVDTIVHPDDRQTVYELINPKYMRKKLKECKTYYYDFRGFLGTKMQYLQLRVVSVGDNSKTAQAVLGYRNVDEEVRKENQRMQVLEDALSLAKKAETARSSFLSNMSHDMRTPLNAIFGYTSLAKAAAKNDDAVTDYLDKIETAGKQILEQIERVLEVSYLESHGKTVNDADCNISDTMRDIYATILPIARQKDITVSLDLNDITHTTVYADAVKLKQAVGHILNNAVKYTNSGGHVALICREECKNANDYSMYKFIVSDNGVGISPSALARIFEPFEREKDTTTSGVFGTGLGLTISKSIIELMGGKIDVDSELGKGSKFTISVALRTLDGEADGAAADTGKIISSIKNKRILVVEDNEINLDIITEILQDNGFDVDTAENGEIAVQKISAAQPDDYAFVLMDIQMPVMDGRTATKKVRNLDNRALADIPIVALSANAFESDKRLSIEAGMDAHLAKPINMPLLLDTVAKIINARG